MINLKFHPAANLFPLIEGQPFQDLVADIQKHGQREPITLHHDGSILDGRNRWLACSELDIEPITRLWDGIEGGEIDFVLSINLHRRHLNESQRAMVADRVANLPNHRPSISAQICAVSQQEAADKLNVSRRAVQTAHQVNQLGDDSLIRAVESGTVSVSAASGIVSLPKPEQAVVVARGEKEILLMAKEIKAERNKEKIQARIEVINEQVDEIATATPVAPIGLFNVISIDPPWPYGTEYDPDGRRAANPYPEMDLEQIAGIDIPAADDCILWLWTTHKFMEHSFEILHKWGFNNKMILTWAKDRIGLGTWLRSQTEFCIMAVKGKPPITLTNQSTIIHGPLREHSRKPDEFFSMVNSLCYGRKLEYFSREPREGWEQFGNDKEKF